MVFKQGKQKTRIYGVILCNASDDFGAAKHFAIHFLGIGFDIAIFALEINIHVQKQTGGTVDQLRIGDDFEA
ncbi:MAG: hypothetical protein DRH37_08835 [Deltaproteobacteria bacterium]|nr:MAG: hypothetical protein DRH37_08835 [Deltaproteobacteria bacterium]